MQTAYTEQVRLARPEDTAGIGEILPTLAGPLYQERFPGKTASDFCQWKYFGNPVGDAIVGLALDGDRVVSVVAGTPKHIKLGANTFLAYELGDFITAPDHRKRGLFSTLINLVCGTAQERGAALVYVRPNEQSFPLLVSRLSFVEVKIIDVRRYVFPSTVIRRKAGIPSAIVRGMGVDWIFRKVALPAPSASIRVEPLTRFDNRAAQLCDLTRDQYNLCISRDIRYLNWRYVDCPTPYAIWTALRGDHMLGYLVGFVNKSQPLGTIVDLFARSDENDAAAALLHVAIDAMGQAGAQSIYSWTVRDQAESASNRVLRRACPLVHKPHFHVAMRFLDQRSPNLPSSGWQLAAGDFDGI